jgi:hypothetical protein
MHLTCIGAAERPHMGELRKQRTPDQGRSGRASSEAGLRSAKCGLWYNEVDDATPWIACTFFAPLQ